MKVEKIRGELIAFDTEEKTVQVLDIDYMLINNLRREEAMETLDEYTFEDDALIPFLQKALDKEAYFIVEDNVLKKVRFPE